MACGWELAGKVSCASVSSLCWGLQSQMEMVVIRGRGRITHEHRSVDVGDWEAGSRLCPELVLVADLSLY